MAKNIKTIIAFAEKGTINRSGYLVFPKLYSITKSGKVRSWQIFVAKTDLEQNLMFIDPDDIRGGDIGDNIAIIWTKYGQLEGKITTSAVTVVETGKNTGKLNSTTCLTQAISDARSLFEKQIKNGSKLNPEDLHTADPRMSDLLSNTSRGEYPWRVFAMAIHNFSKYSKKIVYPATIQPKYDGTLFIVVYHPLLPEIEVDGVMMRIDGYSRSRETYHNQEHILGELYPTLVKYPGLHLVGEIWKDGYGLQEISGSVRRKANTESLKLDYNVFDCFNIGKPGEFIARHEAVKKFIVSGKYVKITPTIPVDSEEAAMVIYQDYVNQGLEGAVIRNHTAPYEYGVNRELRSNQTLKMKPRPDAEWPVVGYDCGEGKESGLVKWICCENDEGVVKRIGEKIDLSSRLTFKVTPNQPNEIRSLIYNNLEKGDLFDRIRGKLLTVAYTRLTENFLPQEPKALRFRDPQVESLLRTSS